MDKWDILILNRRIHKTTLAAPISSDSSDTETAEKDGDEGFVCKRYKCVRDNSDNESDIPIMQRQLALNDEVDMEAIDSYSESSRCEQSSIGDCVSEVREIVRKQPKSSRWVGGIGLPKRNNEVRPE